MEGTEVGQEAKRAIVHLAIGLLRQDEAIRRGTAPPATILDDHLQLGWDKLALICLKADTSPPRHLSDLVSWLHDPVKDWPGIGDILRDEGLEGCLLYFGNPGELCDTLAQEMHLAADTNLEIQDAAFKDILAYCQAQHKTEQYKRARRFLIEHPFLATGVMITSDTGFDDEIRSSLVMAYEPVPATCRIDTGNREQVALCPRCSWPLEWRDGHGGQARCYGELCHQLVGDLATEAKREDAPPEAMRTTRGIQASVVGPELALLELEKALVGLGLQCELWPEVDAYDLLVELGDGTRWAVDVKDAKSPTRLATQAGHFRTVPDWDRACYVFPDHRRRKGYMRTFRSHWARPVDTEVRFVKEFIEMAEATVE